MSRSALIYAAWCVLVLVGLGGTTRCGYSPFASAGRPIFGHGFVGPQHK